MNTTTSQERHGNENQAGFVSRSRGFAAWRLAAGLLGLMVVAARPSGIEGLIPRPAKIEPGDGRFVLTPETRIQVEAGTTGLNSIIRYLTSVVGPATGYSFPCVTNTSGPLANTIYLGCQGADPGFGDEGYELTVTAQGVRVHAPKPAGLFYGVQTLLQLLPAEIFRAQVKPNAMDWTLPAVRLWDRPRFVWRGLLLDVARHYLPPDFIKRFIDLMAMHKLNVLQLHLTDDQGWRLEIKAYPRLTQIGSRREQSPQAGNRNLPDGTPYGPYFYTQAELRELVAYAQSRFVTLLPEIEMPGHGLGALSAYPEFSCTGGPFKVRWAWGVEDDVFCAGNEATFRFLENVLDEVMGIFPGPFIHVGGDECPKARWKQCPKCQARIRSEGLANEDALQGYFTQRIERYLLGKGRRLLGWDEILEGGLPPRAAVMSWRGVDAGLKAAQAGHDVVMSPTTHLYLDYAQSTQPGEPESIGGYVSLKKVYEYEPLPAGFPTDKRPHILGAQGNLWTEYVRTPSHAEFMTYPRAAALAEVVWSPAERKDYQDFYIRLQAHLTRLEMMKVNYRRLTSESKPTP